MMAKIRNLLWLLVAVCFRLLLLPPAAAAFGSGARPLHSVSIHRHPHPVPDIDIDIGKAPSFFAQPNPKAPINRASQVTVRLLATHADSSSSIDETIAMKEATTKSTAQSVTLHMHKHRRNRAVGKIVTSGTAKELVESIKEFIYPNYRVAELGSQLRDVSKAICEVLADSGDGDDTDGTAGHVMLVDVERRFPKNVNDGSRTDAMRQKHAEVDFFPDISTFQEMENLDDWRRVLFPQRSGTAAPAASISSAESTHEQPHGYDALVLDVNSIVGNDLEWTALSIIREFQALNGKDRPLVVLVKSAGLNQWATRLLHGPKVVNNKGSTDGIGPPHVIATRGVQEYRSTIPFVVRSGDAVLEVGCHFGTSTALLQEAVVSGNVADGVNDVDGVNNGESGAAISASNGYCIGVDVGTKIIREAQRKYPDIFFRVGNAWRTADLLRIQQEYLQGLKNTASNDSTGQPADHRLGFDVVYIDVGGLSGADGLIEAINLITSIRYALEPRCMVIKSLCMQRLSSTLVPFWRLPKSGNLAKGNGKKQT